MINRYPNKIRFQHIRAHQKEPKDLFSDTYKHWYGNMMADKLATDSSKKSAQKYYNETGLSSKSKSKSFFPSPTLTSS